MFGNIPKLFGNISTSISISPSHLVKYNKICCQKDSISRFSTFLLKRLPKVPTKGINLSSWYPLHLTKVTVCGGNINSTKRNFTSKKRIKVVEDYTHEEPNPFRVLRHTNYVKLLIGSINKHGKRAIAERVTFNLLAHLKKETGKNPFDVFNEVVENLKPLAQLKNKKVAGVNYKIPSVIDDDRAISVAVRWLVKCSLDRSERGIQKQLIAEVMDVLAGKGLSLKKREESHRQIIVNRPFMKFLRS